MNISEPLSATCADFVFFLLLITTFLMKNIFGNKNAFGKSVESLKDFRFVL